MAIVVDANLVVVLATRDPRVLLVERHFQAWLDVGEDLHAPDLLLYEVANALTRLIVAGRLTIDDLAEVWTLVASLPLQFHSLVAGPQAIAIALQLGRVSAYDAAYLALAQELNATLWTLDGPLARNSMGLGFPVRLIADEQ